MEFGPITKKDISKYLNSNPIIIEAGAHVGNDTIEMASMWPRGTIYALEPVENIFTKLYSRCKNLQNVVPVRTALSKETLHKEIYVSSGSSDGSSSLNLPKEHLNHHPDVLFNEKEFVSCMNLEEFVRKNITLPVDFLWLDLQGLEPEILMNCGSFLEKDKVRVIYSEVNLVENYEGIILYPQFKEFLETKGYVVVKEDLQWGDAGNALFVRKDLVK